MYAEYISKRRDAILDARLEICTALIAFPTVPEFAPNLSTLIRSPDRAAETNAWMLSNTMIASFLDLPGIAMPTIGRSNRLPGSILLSCGQGCDEALLNHAVTLQVGDKSRDERVTRQRFG